jgi:hypothetical protein
MFMDQKIQADTMDIRELRIRAMEFAVQTTGGQYLPAPQLVEMARQIYEFLAKKGAK